MEVAIGIDSHKGSLAVAAVDAVGRVLEVREFPNRPDGHRVLIGWMRGHEEPRKVGIEGSQRYGAALARRLLLEGEESLGWGRSSRPRSWGRWGTRRGSAPKRRSPC